MCFTVNALRNEQEESSFKLMSFDCIVMFAFDLSYKCSIYKGIVFNNTSI